MVDVWSALRQIRTYLSSLDMTMSTHRQQIGHEIDRVASHVEHHNVLMSLPACLVHCILSDWVDVASVIRLDFAFFGGREVFHLQLLVILKSDQFYAKRVERPKNLPLATCYVLPPQHPYTHMLDWIVRRQLKVVHIELHELCSPVVLETLLQKYGEHVRHIRPCEDYTRHLPTQDALIAKYCHNLTAYVGVDCYKSHDGSILSVINNNPHLEKLHIDGWLHIDPARHPIMALHHLKQLKYGVEVGFGDSLVPLVRATPNLQQLSISCNPLKCTEINGDLVLEVARACPHLRTLSCNELHFGPNDSFLKPFFASCKGIVNLDLNMHYELTDTVLIEALSELNSLYFLNLRGCSRLTDRTLQFLSQRFASTLKVLYLDYSVMRGTYYMPDAEQGNYTAAGIASLRAQCTHLHTFHYSVTIGGKGPAPPVDAYESATIVQLMSSHWASQNMILDHCQQMQILVLPYKRYYDQYVRLTLDQLEDVAECCPQLRTVVIEKWKYIQSSDDESTMKKMFPKLHITAYAAVASNFEILEIPV